MTATQAPTPGPLDWDYDKVEMIADLIEKYTYVMSKHHPDLARVAGHNSCAQHILAALAPTAPVENPDEPCASENAIDWPTAPVEASGSEIWPDDVNREEFLRWIEAGKPSPQPSGETRWTEDILSKVTRRDLSILLSCEQTEDPIGRARETLRVILQHALSTTPARAEAQDEGVVKAWDSDVLDTFGGYSQNVLTRTPYVAKTGERVRSQQPLYAHPSPPPAADEDRVRIAVEEVADAIDFFDRVKASSQAEQIAVGRDHWNRLEAAARAVAALKSEGK